VICNPVTFVVVVISTHSSLFKSKTNSKWSNPFFHFSLFSFPFLFPFSENSPPGNFRNSRLLQVSFRSFWSAKMVRKCVFLVERRFPLKVVPGASLPRTPHHYTPYGGCEHCPLRRCCCRIWPIIGSYSSQRYWHVTVKSLSLPRR